MSSTRWVKVGSRTRALRIPHARTKKIKRAAASAPRAYVIKSFSMPVPLAEFLDSTVALLNAHGIPANRSWLCRVAIDSQLPDLLTLPPDDLLREVIRVHRNARAREH